MGSLLHSMTAFGQAAFDLGGQCYAIEIRTANSRFLDIKVRVPWPVPEVEMMAVNRLREVLKRGRVDVNVRMKPSTDSCQETVDLNVYPPLITRRMEAVRDILESAARTLNLESKITLTDVIRAYELMGREAQETVNPKVLLKAMLPALEEALSELTSMRQKEGEAMDRALAESLDGVTVLTDTISSLAAFVPQAVKHRLEERLAALMTADKMPVDPIRLAQEVAIQADKADITEEMARIKSHIEQIRATRKADPPHGRKLEFLLQEIQREVNTVGSKTPDMRIARAVVEIKTEIEKMREIAQNVE